MGGHKARFSQSLGVEGSWLPTPLFWTSSCVAGSKARRRSRARLLALFLQEHHVISDLDLHFLLFGNNVTIQLHAFRLR